MQNNVKKYHFKFLKLEFHDRTRVLSAQVLELANKNYPRRTRVYNTRVPCFSVLHVFQFCILNSSVQIGYVIRINIFQFRSFCVLHSKSLFLFFEFAFFKSYCPDCVFFFLWICFLVLQIVFIFIFVFSDTSRV